MSRQKNSAHFIVLNNNDAVSVEDVKKYLKGVSAVNNHEVKDADEFGLGSS